MAAKTYNPFQTEFATEDELLGNPRSGLKRNPSKAYETIVAAVKADSDSWIQQQGLNYYYVILSGPMTGTYILGPRKKKYVPQFVVGMNQHNVGLLGLFRLRHAAIMKRVGGIAAAVKDARFADGFFNEGFSPDEREWVRLRVEREWVRFRNELLMDDDEYVYQFHQEAEERRVSRIISVRQAMRKEYHKDPNGFEAKFIELTTLNTELKTSAVEQAITAYVLSQAAGVPTEKVIADLREKPKRYLALREVTIPGRLTDRKKYAKVFFRKWSQQEALNSLLTGVEGGLPSNVHYLPQPELIRRAMAGVPSWKQRALAELEERVAMRIPDDPWVAAYKARSPAQPMPPTDPWLLRGIEGVEQRRKEAREELRFELLRTYIVGAVDLQKRLAASGMKTGVFRELLAKRGQPYLRRLADSASAIREGTDLLVEQNEGRILIRALHDQDWPTVYRGHDVAVEAARDVMQASETEAGLVRAEAHKSLARQFVFPPGVRPLVTKAEYKVEGREMDHCVYSMSYYRKMSSFEFAFQTPDGERATLELGTDGAVRQFFGPNDSNPGTSLRQLLNQFLSVNADNIKAMKKGEFPVRPTKANPLELASSDMGFMSIWDKDLEQWGMVLFSKSDFGRYRMSGDKKLLSKSVIGYIAASKYQPNWQKPPLPKSAQVSYALAAPGFGPLLYNVALKSLQKKGYDKLYPDYNRSVNAERFWSRFPDGFMKVMPAAAFEKTFGVPADEIIAAGAPLSTAEKADLLRDAQNQFGSVHRAMDAETGVSSVKLARVAANPLAKADANTAAILFEDKDAPASSGFYTVLFDRSDWEKYKKTGNQKHLDRSIIGFLDTGEKRKIRYDDVVPKDAVQVSGAVALPGYGPMLYATALKFLERRKKNKLYPDSMLSAHAVRFWSRFPKGYMEPASADEYKAAFGVSPTSVTGYASKLSAEDKETLALRAYDLFEDIYNGMDSGTGSMRSHLPRDPSAHRQYDVPVPMAANPLNHFPRRNRR